MSQQHKPVRIAVVGCGAVTQSFHLPVLAGHAGVSIAALVDPDVARARRLAALYHAPTVLPSAEELDGTVADAALIATPAFLHAPGSIALMNRGLHVLVEKPMALTLADGERMVTTARDRGVILTVGLFRRLLPAIRLFRAALDAGQIGDLLNVTAEVGDAYTWNLTTLAGMRRQEAGGGMLVDMGSHVLDLLLYICDATPALVEYTDNAGSGIETDCTIELGLSRRGVFVPAHVELSRTRKLTNAIRVEGTRGTLEWKFGERARVLLHTPSTYVDTLTASVRDCAIEARWRDEPEQQGYEGFRAQIDDFVGAINGDHPPQLSGASVLPSVQLIEQCYAQRRPLPEPWFAERLPQERAAVSRPEGAHRVLITGASGFIGCRLSERLHFDSDWRVKAMIRTPGRAVRLARMPIEFAIGDLASAPNLDKALDGCTAVVHAGIGTSWRRSERIATNVDGTRKLVDAALRAGVKRFVHISTISLYGDRVNGVITEETPAQPKKGWDYAESKYAAEQIVLEAAAKGLPAVILRVAVVYGPHNMTITARPLEHLVKDRLFLADCDTVPSNTIYVDNLCHGIQLALDGGPEINGQTFLLTDDDGYTWGEYFGYFADRLGATVHHVPKPAGQTGAASAAAPSLPARWLRSTRDVIMSSETKALARRIYLADPWGTPVRWGIARFPAAAEKVKRLIRPEEGMVYRPNPVATDELPPFTVDPIDARVSAEKAARVLGYQPLIARPRAMELTLAWARHARLVPDLSRDAIAAGR
ncbi:MAG: NAD-dependent epimerase/dehydratase [Acidobacteria bacterium]|nr:NAD-dependent epimerase/dehydratase [Acidobacteriota bacterium]